MEWTFFPLFVLWAACCLRLAPRQAYSILLPVLPLHTRYMRLIILPLPAPFFMYPIPRTPCWLLKQTTEKIKLSNAPVTKKIWRDADGQQNQLQGQPVELHVESSQNIYRKIYMAGSSEHLTKLIYFDKTYIGTLWLARHCCVGGPRNVISAFWP